MLLEQIAMLTNSPVQRLNDFAKVAEKSYEVYPIEKRSGEARWIEQPAKPIKALQRIVVNLLLEGFEQHPSCMGYRNGTSIFDVAKLHEEFRFTLRVDFTEFFWSFTAKSIQEFITKSDMGLSEEDIDFVTKITTRHGRLTMGAPSSPIITNIMLFDLDRRIAELATELGCVYTRYADDLLFSSKLPNVLSFLFERLSLLIEAWDSPRLSINEAKTRYLSRRYRRLVLGLVITPDGKISVGRARKRRLRSLVHKWQLGGLEPQEIGALRGELAWVHSVEPTIIQSLVAKYGLPQIEQLAPFVAKLA